VFSFARYILAIGASSSRKSTDSRAPGKIFGRKDMREAGHVRVWDPLVRLSHWGMAGAFLVAWATSEDDFADLHVLAGYTVLGLAALRLVWGVIGTRHARFASFVRGPRTVLAYLRDMALLRAPATVGHNPAAGAMIVALLAGLTLTGVSGVVLYGADEGAGPLAGLIGPLGFLAHGIKEVHEVLAGFTIGLVGLHVGGVAFSSVLHRENLVRAMVTGVKVVRPEAAHRDAPTSVARAA
jgi:cytochrome b